MPNIPPPPAPPPPGGVSAAASVVNPFQYKGSGQESTILTSGIGSPSFNQNLGKATLLGG